ncbi:MAG: hypothetical protein R3324_21805, partial [Halobacteriales archaeon]|nr:hypothetical protein [Halobacteriales archaeon]
MLRAEAVADGVTPVSQLRPTITVRADGWRAFEDVSRFDVPTLSESGHVDDSVVGEATTLSLPPGPVTVARAETGEPVELDPKTVLTTGSYEVTVESAIRTHVSFTLSTPARFERNQERTVIDFAARTPVR